MTILALVTSKTEEYKELHRRYKHIPPQKVEKDLENQIYTHWLVARSYQPDKVSHRTES